MGLPIFWKDLVTSALRMPVPIQRAGLAFIVSYWIGLFLLATETYATFPALCLFAILVIPLLSLIIPLVRDWQYVRISAPYSSSLALVECSCLHEVLKKDSEKQGWHEMRHTLKRLSFYVDLAIADVSGSDLASWAPAFRHLGTLRRRRTTTAEKRRAVKHLFSLLEQLADLPQAPEKPVTADEVASAMQVVHWHDASRFVLSVAKHWTFPSLRLKKRLVSLILRNPEANSPYEPPFKPGSYLERKFAEDLRTIHNREDKLRGRFFLWMTVLANVCVVQQSIAYSAVWLPESALSGKSYWEVNAISLMFFVPAILLYYGYVYITDYAMLSGGWIEVGISSRLHMAFFAILIVIPAARLLVPGPAIILELVVCCLLILVSTVAILQLFHLYLLVYFSAVKVSEALLAVGTVDLMRATEEKTPEERTRRLRRTVKRCRVYLWLLKKKRRTGDAVADQVNRAFLDTFSKLLSLLIAESSVPSSQSQEELREDVARIAVACINRAYRDVESSVSRFRRVVLMAAEPSRVGHILELLLRPVVRYIVGSILTVLVFLITSWLAPSVLKTISHLADIRGLLGL